MIGKKCLQLAGVSSTLILALFIIACNSQPPQAAEPDQVSLRLDWVHQADYAGYYVAQQEGYYKQENLDVNISPTDFEMSPIERVLLGENDFGVTSGSDLLKARAEDKPVVALAILYRRDPHLFFSFVEQGVKTAEDLVGKRVGVFPTQELSYHLLLSLADIELSQVDYVPITEFTIRPLIQEDVDILSGYATNEPLQAQEHGYEVNIISTSDYGVSLPAQVIFTTEDMIKNNPDLVHRFIRASLKGYKVVVEDPEKGLLATLKVDETLNAEHQQNIVKAMISLVAPDQNPVGYMDAGVWQQTIDVLIEQEVLKTSLDPQTVFTTQFLE